MKHPRLLLSLVTLNAILFIAMFAQQMHDDDGMEHQIACSDKAHHQLDVCLQVVQNSSAWPDSAQPMIDACGATAQAQLDICSAWKVW